MCVITLYTKKIYIKNKINKIEEYWIPIFFIYKILRTDTLNFNKSLLEEIQIEELKRHFFSKMAQVNGYELGKEIRF